MKPETPSSYSWRRHAHWKTRERMRLIATTTIAIGLVVLAISSYVLWPAKAEPAALQQAYSIDGVTITEESHYYAITPFQPDATATLNGLLFYPGGAVPAKAYLYHMATVAAKTGLNVYVVKMPLNMAVFAPNRALAVMEDNPTISNWLISGHSLGGAMACRHVIDHMDLYVGLLLQASYCDKDIQTYPGEVLVLLGGNDAVMDTETIAENSTNLPVGRTTTEIIGGMVHAQFGSYGNQAGDGVPQISDAGALESQIRIIQNWLASIPSLN